MQVVRLHVGPVYNSRMPFACNISSMSLSKITLNPKDVQAQQTYVPRQTQKPTMTDRQTHRYTKMAIDRSTRCVQYKRNPRLRLMGREIQSCSLCHIIQMRWLDSGLRNIGNWMKRTTVENDW